MTLAFATTVLVVQATADRLFWGAAFASAKTIVDFTIVKGLSSRGYEPAWYYLTDVAAWTNVVVFGLALFATRRQWRLAMWAWMPLLLLSLAPHKEPRYVIPLLPFVALLAACGLERVLVLVQSPVKGHPSRLRRLLPLTCLLSIFVAAVLEADRYHFTRTTSEVRLARQIDPLMAGDNVAAEPLWTLGGRLYLRSPVEVIPIEPAAVSDDRSFSAYLNQTRANWIIVRADTCEAIMCARVLRERAFQRTTFGSDQVLVFRRAR